MKYLQRKIKTFTVKRPWGKFDQFTKNEKTTVKIHFFKRDGAWSLQFHNHRAEFWYILSGHPIVTIGKKKIKAKPGDEFMVPKLKKHRIEAKGEAVQLLEICYGNFNEDDIVRIKDKYGRAKK